MFLTGTTDSHHKYKHLEQIVGERKKQRKGIIIPFQQSTREFEERLKARTYAQEFVCVCVCVCRLQLWGKLAG